MKPPEIFSNKTKKPPATLTVIECHRLLEELHNLDGSFCHRLAGRRNYCMAVLMLETGIRVGELVQLTIGDVYFNGEPVNSLCIRAEIAKRGHGRMIPLSTKAKDALKNMVSMDGDMMARLSHKMVFKTWKNNKAITARQVQRIIKQGALKSLGRPIHPHVLRHTFGSRLMRKCNSRIVQELLGHKHLSSTQIYTHPNGEDLTKAINSLGDD